ncbi:uncharacterized protein E0L32_009426 [Thyridium curvatum]|uniref:NAD(P)-binding protein n=1 Tax=Thyridium curvatum TaxID=1093900 RepID=A0A507AJ44_9PEZI|nr:uncharacterized protein E0L32_009426 [Thyridium curvatum]TPX09382.1 hypothetical protein E0L32_009426 [Thyridium curvatum]
MASKNALVIGANRGIGLNILKALAGSSWNVTGSIRPQSATDPSVEDLKATGARILKIDYLDEGTIKTAAQEYGDEPLDLLVNVGGLPPHPKAWQEQTNDAIVEKFRVMAVGPFLATKHFLPSLEKAAEPKVVNISSSFGSISTNTLGTCMAYRTAKAALNQNSVTLAREWEKEGRKVTIVCMEPGFLSTRLTEWDGEDDMETCIAGIMNVIDGITHKDNGAFLKWDGSSIPF